MMTAPAEFPTYEDCYGPTCLHEGPLVLVAVAVCDGCGTRYDSLFGPGGPSKEPGPLPGYLHASCLRQEWSHYHAPLLILGRCGVLRFELVQEVPA